MQQFIKQFEDGSTQATRYEPNFLDYKNFGGDYFDGKQWFSDVAVFADDFSDVSNWSFDGFGTAWTHSSSGEMIQGNAGYNYHKANRYKSLTANKKYRVSFNISNMGYQGTFRIGDNNGSTLYITTVSSTGRYNIDFATNDVVGNFRFFFELNASSTFGISDFAIIPLNDDGSIDTSNATPYTVPFTYLPIRVNVDDQSNVIDIDAYAMPTLTEDYVKADKVEAEMLGKNACTAWVNFDGNTTPPTIRDSYNVETVIRTATGHYDIYFKEDMDNTNYSVSGSREGDGADTSINPYSFGTNKISVRTIYDSIYNNNGYISVQIMGGKN